MDVAQLNQPTTGFPQPGPNEMALSVLLETAIQRSYHQLMVMTDMFPSLSDKDKKIELVTFACRTRQLFMRIFALVKFRKSAHINVSSILQFLDQQSFIFVDTADFLYNLARVKLVNARLPNFAITTAVDVLTLGTYPKLPTCIKERILPIESINDLEKDKTLKNLNRIIQCRLALSDLPSQFNNFKIEHGHVEFHVKNEFEIMLTVPNDDYKQPWRLLFVRILVRNSQDPNRTLVHQLQVKYIHEVLQKRLYENDKPLIDLYKSLHFFCQSLKLEVLFQQMYALNEITYARFYRIIEYSNLKQITIKYWLEYSKNEYDFRFSIVTSEQQTYLQTTHYPPLNWKDHKEIDTIFKSNELLIEKIIHQIIKIRSRRRLNDVKAKFDSIGFCKSELNENKPCLKISLFKEKIQNEILMITIDYYSGLFHASLPFNIRNTSILTSIEAALNSDINKLKESIVRLRGVLLVHKCALAIKNLNGCQKLIYYNLPIVSYLNNDLANIYNKFENKNCLFVELAKYTTDKILVMITCENEYEIDYDLDFEYYLLKITKCKFEGDMLDSSTQFYKLISMSKLKKSSLLSRDDLQTLPSIFSQVKKIVSCLDEKLPMMNFVSSLSKNSLLTQSIQFDDRLKLTKLNILNAPKLESKELQLISDELWDIVLTCTVRYLNNYYKPTLIQKNAKLVPIKYNFSIEFKFNECLWDINNQQFIDLYIIYLEVKNFDSLFETFKDKWYSMCQMYKLLRQLNRALKQYSELNKSFKIIEFNFKKLTIAYGTNFNNKIQFRWSNNQYDIFLANSQLKGNVELPSLNYHYYFINEIKRYFNENPFDNIINLVLSLSETIMITNALSKLQNVPKFSLTGPQHVLIPQPGFMVLINSFNHIKLTYLSRYYLDIYFDSFNLVKIKPNCYLINDLIEDLPAFYAFLQLFRDQSVDEALKRNFSENTIQLPSNSQQQHNQQNHVFLPPQSPAIRQPLQPQVQSPYFAQSPSIQQSQMPNPSPSSLYQHQQYDTSFATGPSSLMSQAQSPAGSFLASPATNSPFNTNTASEFPPLQSPLPVKSPYPQAQSQIQQGSQQQQVKKPLVNLSQPIYLSQNGFCKMISTQNLIFTPLETFLASIYLKKTLTKLIQQYQNYTRLLRIQINNEITSNYIAFSISLIPFDQIQSDLLQEYLNTRILCPPFKLSSITSFFNLITINDPKILKEFIMLLDCEMKYNYSWRLRFFWTMPFSLHTMKPIQIYQPGQQGFKRDPNSNKVYFMFNIFNVNHPQTFTFICMYDSLNYVISFEPLKTMDQIQITTFDSQIIDLLNHGILTCKQRNDPNLAYCTLMHLINSLNQQQQHHHQQPQIIPQQQSF